MPQSFKPAEQSTKAIEVAPPRMRWVLLAGCVALAWQCWRGPQTAATRQIAAPTASRAAARAPGTGAPGTGQDSTPAVAPGAGNATAIDPATGRPAAAVGFGLSTINIIVHPNDTLDAIFRRLKLSLTDLASLRGLPGLKARLDSLRPGESLRLMHRDGSLFGLERRLNESETLKVVRDSSGLRADVLQNPLEARTRTVHAVIANSLFEAVQAAGGHDQTAVALADIFAWDIDFVLDVQPGDSFAVSYQELYQDGVYVKDGPILAASFTNQGRTYRAVRYIDPEGNAHYYTADGRSVHKAFLRAPLEFTRVSSGFNSARRHPILNLIRAHKGVDYAAPIGTPVRAAGDGRVAYAGPKGGYGNVVEIDHSRGIVTVYGHLSRFAKGLRTGQHVTQGSVIAYVGMTGLATGPHLHYEYRVDGVFKNPQTVSLPDAEPIDARWRADFLARSAPLLAALEVPTGPALVSR
ncbi:MAG TPA: peptidoglycan DD-metalloendopeptidase family protein [Steroidobacteraceae bacterium]|nr:peptidoglycan DD-metalloendopeptidase family protein [Steroidobacteraceae bacterium]